VVETNDPKNGKYDLKIVGNVEKFVTIAPRHVKMVGTAGSDIKAEVTIIPEKKYPFQIVGVSAEKGINLTYHLKPVERDNRPAFVLTIENTRKETGRYHDTLHLITDSSLRPEIPIWIFGEIREPEKQEKR